MTGPLNGVVVVALEQAVAAPLATRHLADLGARVIKIERPDGGDFARHYDSTVEGQSSYFVWLNRGKESVVLDLKDPNDHAVLMALVRGADVLVQNLAPGAADRLSLSADHLRRDDPRLVVCDISGFGPGGPDSARKAYDLLIQCETGVLMTTGTPDEPSKVGISIADIATGMYAYSGILAALFERERTGVGASLHVAMVDAMSEWMTQPAYHSRYGGTPPRRTGARHASIAPYGPYATADGDVFLGVQNDRDWARLCIEVLGDRDLVTDPRFATNTRRVENQAPITALLELAFSGMSRQEALEALDLAGIAGAAMRQPGELFDHPQLVARRRIARVELPGGGVVEALRPPVVDGRDRRCGAVPSLGQHTDAVRAEALALLRSGTEETT